MPPALRPAFFTTRPAMTLYQTRESIPPGCSSTAAMTAAPLRLSWEGLTVGMARGYRTGRSENRGSQWPAVFNRVTTCRGVGRPAVQ